MNDIVKGVRVLLTERETLKARLVAIEKCLEDVRRSLRVERLEEVEAPTKSRRQASHPPRKPQSPVNARAARGDSVVATARRNHILAFLGKQEGRCCNRKALRQEFNRYLSQHEPKLTADQRESAYKNTLTTLGAQKRIARTSDTWGIRES